MSSDRRAPAAPFPTGGERNARPRQAGIGRSNLRRARLATLAFAVFGRARSRGLRAGSVAVAALALTLVLGVATAHASSLSQVSSFGAAQLSLPIGVAVDQSSGNVFVADCLNHQVAKFDARGNFIATFGASRLGCALNVAVGVPGGPSAGKVFVGDGTRVVEFDKDGNFISSNDGSATPQGKFQSLAGVAVDQSGNLWTVDSGTFNIDEFDPSGKFLQQWTDPRGVSTQFGFNMIAVDSTHNSVYLWEANGGVTARFTLTGKRETTIDNGFSGPEGALALDPQTGNLYVDHTDHVAVYDHTGLPIDSLSLSTSGSFGLAFHSDGSGGKFGLRDLYVADRSARNVTIYGPPTTAGPPLVLAAPARDTSPTAATLNGTVLPEGNDTTCKFQFVDDADFQASGYSTATTAPCTPSDLGSGFAYSQASAPVTGLATPTVVYHFHVIATNSAGTTTGPDTTFQTPPGDWAPFSRCPVDDPAMLATDGFFTHSSCLASNSTHGSITLGNITTATGNTNLQAGLVTSSSGTTIIPPAGGALVADPVQISSPVGPVTAVTTSAGAPSNFCLFCGIELNQPIITIPVKIQLENPTLGPSCFIGSDQNPIVLNPENTDVSNVTLAFQPFDANGAPDPNLTAGDILERIAVTGAVQGDNTFSVPGATGCGSNGSLDAAVDAVVGLPSPSGSNHLVLDDAASYLASDFFNGGQVLANDWHIAFG